MRHRLQQFAPLVVHAFEEAEFHLPVHGHTYYEVVYIRAGHGQHWLNGHTVSYAPSNLFFIAPEDEHRFDIAESTRFVFIKFTADYVQPTGPQAVTHPIQGELLALLHDGWLKEHALAVPAPATTMLARLVDNLTDLASDAAALRQPSTRHQLMSLLLLAREALDHAPETTTAVPEASPEALLGYVHQHIYQPALLRMAEVARRFHLAPSYVGAYFRRTVGLGYRQYVHRYRLQLLESRARQGATLKQLAAEFGFTDESHLSRYFREQTGRPFKSYRPAAAPVPESQPAD